MAEGCPPALSNIDRPLILVEGIVFVHVHPKGFPQIRIHVLIGFIDPVVFKKERVAGIKPITRVIGLIREEEIHEKIRSFVIGFRMIHKKCLLLYFKSSFDRSVSGVHGFVLFGGFFLLCYLTKRNDQRGLRTKNWTIFVGSKLTV